MPTPHAESCPFLPRVRCNECQGRVPRPRGLQVLTKGRSPGPGPCMVVATAVVAAHLYLSTTMAWQPPCVARGCWARRAAELRLLTRIYSSRSAPSHGMHQTSSKDSSETPTLAMQGLPCKVQRQRAGMQLQAWQRPDLDVHERDRDDHSQTRHPSSSAQTDGKGGWRVRRDVRASRTYMYNLVRLW